MKRATKGIWNLYGDLKDKPGGDVERGSKKKENVETHGLKNGSCNYRIWEGNNKLQIVKYVVER